MAGSGIRRAWLTRWRVGVDIEFFWVYEPGGNVEHLTEHDLKPDDIEHAYVTADEFTTSRSSGRLAFYGQARDGRDIFVVYEALDATTWYVVTAYRV